MATQDADSAQDTAGTPVRIGRLSILDTMDFSNDAPGSQRLVMYGSDNAEDRHSAYAAENAYADERGLVCVQGQQEGAQPRVHMDTSYYAHDVDTALAVQAIPDSPVLLCTVAIEGTLLRLHWFSGRWLLSTHRKLDAFKSRWGSDVSFGAQFLQGLSAQLSMPVKLDSAAAALGLDTAYAHCFIVRPTTLEARLACAPASPPSEPVVWFAGSVPLGAKRQAPTFDMPLRTTAVPSVPRLGCKTLAEAQALVAGPAASALPPSAHGLFVYLGTPDKQAVERLCKVWLPGMLARMRVRNNEPDLLVRYIQLFWNADTRVERTLREAFLELYGSAGEFAFADHTLAQLAQEIAVAYRLRYMAGQYVRLPHEKFRIMAFLAETVLAKAHPANETMLLQAAILAVVSQPARGLAAIVRQQARMNK